MGEPLVTFKRPDGSLLQVERGQAAQFSALGYKEESLEEQGARAAAAAHEADFSGTGEKVKTFIEGAGSGVTLGLSDKLLQWSSDAGITGTEWRDRAEVNPGTRLAGELVGATVGAVASGGVGGAYTPVGALTQGAGALTKGIGGFAARGAVRGAIEGAGFGLGGEISHTALTGDPLTVEGAMAGMGWGAVFGGGLGAVGGAIEGRMARKATVEAAAAQKTAALTLPEEKWGVFKEAIRDSAARAEGAFKSAADEVEAMAGAGKTKFTEAARAKSVGFVEPWTEQIPQALKEKKQALEAFKDMKTALKEKNWAGLEEAAAGFDERVAAMNKVLEATQGVGFPGAVPVPQTARLSIQKDASAALHQLKDLGAAGATLKGFAETPGGFVGMGQGKFDKMAGAIETFLKVPSAELAGAQDGVRQGIASMAEHVGVASEGGPVSQLRGVWETLKQTNTAKAARDATEAAAGNASWIKKAGTSVAGAGVARATGTGFMGFAVGKSIAAGLLGVKGAVLGTINDLASTWVPRAGKALTKIGPQVTSLATRLDGTTDLRETRKSAQELMLARAKEIREAAPSVRDTLYKGVSGMSMHHPEFAVGAHQLAVKQFMYLYDKLPRDPGNAFSKLESLWRADPVATAKFDRYYGVFQNPMSVITETLTGKRTMSTEEAEGIQNMWPALFTRLRVAALERMSDPKVMDKMSYEDQIHMGLITGLRMHSTMTPQFITQQQQMYQERQKPLTIGAQPTSPGTSGGRPDKSPGATGPQISTER